MAKGTYAYVSITKPSSKKLFDLYKDINGGIAVTPKDDYHITTTYSRNMVKLRSKPVYLRLEKEHFSFGILGDNNNYLVLKVKHEQLNELHQEAMDKGGTWDYPEYIPHISLCSNFVGGGKEMNSLELPDFDIGVFGYYVEELKE